MPRDWDTFYESGGSLGDKPVFAVRAYEHLLPPGPVLDLASGTGRNAIFLASRGKQVLLVDASASALEQAKKTAFSLGLVIKTQKYNLENGIPKNLYIYSAIIITYYLQRSLLNQISQYIRQGGMVIIEGYNKKEAKIRGRTQSPYYWEMGELLLPTPGFKLMAGGEGHIRGHSRSWAVWVKQ